MSFLTLLLFGLLMLGSQSSAAKKPMPSNKPSESAPGKTFIRVLPSGVQLSHDKHMVVHTIARKPSKKCGTCTRQRQYQHLRVFLKQNLQQLGKGIIVLTNLTSAQRKDVSDLSEIINNHDNELSDEAINLQGIQRLIYTLMTETQKDHSHDRAKYNVKPRPPKAFGTSKIMFPYEDGPASSKANAQDGIQQGMPTGFKRMAFSHRRTSDGTQSKPLTSFKQQRLNYFGIPKINPKPSFADYDFVADKQNAENPMLFVVGENAESPVSAAKNYKYYGLPIKESQSLANRTGEYKSLDRRWKRPKHTGLKNATRVHCATLSTKTQRASCRFKVGFDSQMLKAAKLQKVADSKKSIPKVKSKFLRPRKHGPNKYSPPKKPLPAPVPKRTINYVNSIKPILLNYYEKIDPMSRRRQKNQEKSEAETTKDDKYAALRKKIPVYAEDQKHKRDRKIKKKQRGKTAETSTTEPDTFRPRQKRPIRYGKQGKKKTLSTYGSEELYNTTREEKAESSAKEMDAEQSEDIGTSADDVDTTADDVGTTADDDAATADDLGTTADDFEHTADVPEVAELPSETSILKPDLSDLSNSLQLSRNTLKDEDNLDYGDDEIPAKSDIDYYTDDTYFDGDEYLETDSLEGEFDGKGFQNLSNVFVLDAEIDPWAY